MKKVNRWLSVATLLASIAAFLYFWYRPYERVDPFSLIPEDVVYALESDEPLNDWKSFYQSEFWGFMKHQERLAELDEDARYLDSLIQSNRKLLKRFGDHHLLISAHMLGQDYDFLFYLDLRKGSKVELSNFPFQTLLGKDYKVSRLKYRTKDIVSISYENGDPLYLSLVANYLVCSYTRSLVHQAIERGEQKSDPQFTWVRKEIGHKGLCRFYVNYPYLYDYYTYYFEGNALTQSVLDQFGRTGLDVQLDKNSIRAKGLTSAGDNAAFIDLLHKHGNGSWKYPEVLSDKVAALQSIHLDNVVEFYRDLITLRSADPEELANYEALKEQIEKKLKLNLEEDLLSWMGKEMVVAQLASQERELLIAIRTKKIKDARKKLERMQKQIKRKTPARFKKTEYRGHEIYYLELQSFFKLLFGKRFERMTKPYYTIIDDFVVFSDNPKSLERAIGHYEEGMVLSKDIRFQQSTAALPRKACLISYVNSPLIYNSLENMGSSDTRSDLQSNRSYLQYLQRIVLSYTAEKDGGFSNRIHMHLVHPNQED